MIIPYLFRRPFIKVFHCHVSLLEGMFLCRFLDLSLNTCCTNLTKHAPFPLPGWQSPSCRLCEHRRCGPDQWWVLGSTPHAGCNAVVNLLVFGWDSVVKHGNIPGGHSMGLGGRSSVSLCLGEKISTSSSFAVIGGLNRMIVHAVFH